MGVSIRSRYWSLPPLEVPGPEGPVPALPIRPQPAPPSAATVTHMVTGVESLEYLAWRFYGRSAAWWHIADANDLSFPLDYRPGMTVNVPQGTGVGRVLRTRRF